MQHASNPAIIPKPTVETPPVKPLPVNVPAQPVDQPQKAPVQAPKKTSSGSSIIHFSFGLLIASALMWAI